MRNNYFLPISHHRWSFLMVGGHGRTATIGRKQPPIDFSNGLMGAEVFIAYVTNRGLLSDCQRPKFVFSPQRQCPINRSQLQDIHRRQLGKVGRDQLQVRKQIQIRTRRSRVCPHGYVYLPVQHLLQRVGRMLKKLMSPRAKNNRHVFVSLHQI